MQPVLPPEKLNEDILLFFKLYDPFKEKLSYVGRLFIKGSGNLVEILSKLNEMAGFALDEEIQLFAEMGYEPCLKCNPVNKELTFFENELDDGDIICFQKSLQGQSIEQFRYPYVSSFLDYVHNRQVVDFRSFKKPKEDEFCLELSKNNIYDEVVGSVAKQLGLDDSSKIRLTSHNCYSQQPQPWPIKYQGVKQLADMLIDYNQISDILYYEVLDLPLPELERLKTLKVAIHHATKDEVVNQAITLPKESTVGAVLLDLKTKVELSHPNAELRLLLLFCHRICKIPEEEKNIGPNDQLIAVHHFINDRAQNQTVQFFGAPFFLVIHEGETLAEVKIRIQNKLQLPDEEFSKWKFAYLSSHWSQYLQDSDLLSNRFQKKDVHGAWGKYLGLEHTDNASDAATEGPRINN